MNNNNNNNIYNAFIFIFGISFMIGLVAVILLCIKCLYNIFHCPNNNNEINDIA